MAWFLNNFLTTFRSRVNARYPQRSKASDGTIGDLAHQQTASQHNPDADGSVDAWDLDVNLLGSSVPTGSSAEILAMRAVLAEFQKQPQAQLWIFQGRIANRDINNWQQRIYTGPNPHDKHAHLQSRQSQETKPYTGELVIPAANATRVLKQGMTGPDVKALQEKLKIKADGVFGPATKAAVVAFQQRNGLVADGIVGPATRAKLGLR